MPARSGLWRRLPGSPQLAGLARQLGSEGHDVPPDVMSGVIHWLHRGQHDLVAGLDRCRREAIVGGGLPIAATKAGAYTRALLSTN